jgi:GlpG protein
MPICAGCGKEAAREDMFGAVDDLRCGECAQRSRRKYAPAPVTRRRWDAPPRVSLTLIVIAAAVYFLSGIKDADLGLHYLWATPGYVWSGQVWRLWTTIFAHGGFFHFAFNCYALWLLGGAVEGAMGHWRYLVFILAAAGAAHGIEFLAEPKTAIGLSGVVYGVFGYLWALRRYKDYARQALPDDVVIQIVGWFFLCIVLSATNVLPIANVAHGAGAAFGYAVGWATLRKRSRELVVALVAAGLLLPFVTQFMFWNARFQDYRRLAAQVGPKAAEVEEGLHQLKLMAERAKREGRLFQIENGAED